jgi:hypothetical protein
MIALNERDQLDLRLEQTILTLLLAREHGATICPSEAARAVSPDDWRSLMERTRAAAQRLVEEQVLVITQKGEVVDLSTARGPIRLKLK